VIDAIGAKAAEHACKTGVIVLVPFATSPGSGVREHIESRGRLFPSPCWSGRSPEHGCSG